MNEREFLSQAFRDPSWLLHQVDPVGDQALFVQVDREVYRRSLFLDNRLAARQPPQQVTALAPAVAYAEGVEARCCHAILHVSHCGSTLLSRLLESIMPLLALREPYPFRTLAMLRRDLDHPLTFLDPKRYPALEHALLSLLERRFPDDEPALIKATSDCGNMGAALLQRHPDNRLLLVGMKLEPFLATMLRSDLRREETRNHAASRLADFRQLSGDRAIRLYHLSPGELAALNWLSAMAHFVELIQSSDSDRCQLLDFETFLDNSPSELDRAARHLGGQPEKAAVHDVLEGPIMQAYSKDPGMRYGVEARRRELDQSRKQHADAIREGLEWAARTLDSHPNLEPLAHWLGS